MGIFNKLRALRRQQGSCCFYKPLTTVITIGLAIPVATSHLTPPNPLLSLLVFHSSSLRVLVFFPILHSFFFPPATMLRLSQNVVHVLRCPPHAEISERLVSAPFSPNKGPFQKYTVTTADIELLHAPIGRSGIISFRPTFPTQSFRVVRSQVAHEDMRTRSRLALVAIVFRSNL